MKTKIMLIALVVLLAGTPLFFGYSSVSTHKSSNRVRWQEIGDIASTTVSVTPAVGARDYSAMIAIADVKTVEWVLPSDAGNLDLRFRMPSANDDAVIEIFLARGATYQNGSREDSFVKAFILTLKAGSQTGPDSDQFVDTVTETQDYWGAGTVVDSGTDRIGRYKIAVDGYSKMIIIATTIDAQPLTVDAAWYSE